MAIERLEAGGLKVPNTCRSGTVRLLVESNRSNGPPRGARLKSEPNKSRWQEKKIAMVRRIDSMENHQPRSRSSKNGAQSSMQKQERRLTHTSGGSNLTGHQCLIMSNNGKA